MRITTPAWPFLALIMLIPLTLAAQNLPGGSAFTVTRDSGSGIQINFELPDWEMETLQRNGETFSQIRVPGIPNLFIEEEETLPVFSTMIAIPYSGGVNLRLSEDLPEFRPGLQLDFAEALASERRSGRYQEALYPAAPVLISEPMVLRDFRVVTLNVHPFQWDSASGELLVREEITINLDFNSSPAPNEMELPASLSPAFAKTYRGLIINHEQAMGRIGDSHHPRLLVIYGYLADATYQDKVDEYVAWKQQKGYIVHSASTATTGTTSGEIKAYIQGQYDNLATRPDYIVLIGDTSGSMPIPTYSSYIDYYYTWLAGSDNLGDVVIGRISVETTEQMVNYMAKVKSLEENLNLDLAAWLDRMVLVGDTASSGISTVYTNEYIYDTSLAINPDYTYTKNYSNSPPAATTNAAINQGVAFYNYRGYIGMSSWPGTMSSMINAYRLFHAVFITCATGNFYNNTSTTESVVRYGSEASLGGAVTAIGMATSSTHTPMNNCLDVGIFHGIYPLGMRNMAEAMLYGKLYLYTVYGNSNPVQAYDFSGFCNIMGDPIATVYVGIPSEFTLTAPASIAAGETSLMVTVEDEAAQPVEGASVALTNASGQQALAFTGADGTALLEFASGLSGTLKLSVDKDDFKTLVDSLIVESSGGLVCDGVAIDDSANGNGDGEANSGESLDLYVSLNNTTSGILTPFGEASCNDPYVTLIDYDRIEFNPIPAGSSGESIDPITLQIAPNCPDQHQFVLNFEILDGLYSTFIPVIVSNGRLEIASHTFVDSPGNLVFPGDTWPLILSLQNTGSADLAGISATLSSQNTFFEVTDAQGYYGTINAGASAGNNTDIFTIFARSTCLDGMVIPLTLDLSNSAGFQQSIPLSFTIGQTTINDPLGQDAYGYFIFGQEDTGYDQCPAYDWIGIAPAEGGSGTALNLSDPGSSYDEGDQTGAVAIQTVNLPFTFKYYGVDYSQASISSNGFIAFGETNDADWRNWRLPDAGGPSPMVAVFWDDLQLNTGSYVYTWYNSALHYFVVEWYNVISGYDRVTPQTFQAILYDPVHYPTHTGDGQIKLQYNEFNNIDLGDGDTYPHGNYCTIGIEDHTETVGLEYTYGNTWPTAASPLADESALFITTLPLIPDYPYVVMEQVEVLDANSNAHLEPGEAAELHVRLGNRGLVEATGVSAVLSSSDPYVSITAATASYGAVPAQGSAWSQSNYAIQVAPNCPADHQLTFTLDITSATGSWSNNFQLGVFAPEFEFRHMAVNDYSGDQNGILDPGETATISIELHNTGEIPTPAGTATLNCSTTGISIGNGSDSFSILTAGSHATLYFEISASASMNDGTLVELVFNAAGGSTTASLIQHLEVGAPLEVLIGEGTQTQSYPLDRYYNYSAHEAIYLASEIELAGTLKSIAFYKTSGNDSNPIESVSIYMKNTTESTLSAGTYSTSGYTLVYSGSFPNNAATGWMEVDLNPMFVYDGVSNLAVLTVKGYQQWISDYPRWNYSSTPAQRARQNRSDSAAPSNLLASPNLPNLRLKIFPDLQMLLPPQNLSAEASHGYVLLDWDAPVTGQPDSYKVYRNGSYLANPAGETYTDLAVNDGTTYQYYVTAVYDGEESPATPTVSATPDMYPPANLAALPGNAQVTLSWTAAEGRSETSISEAIGARDRAIDGYRIYRNGSPIATVAGTSHNDTGLANGVTYTYYVTTLYSDPAGESEPSDTVEAAPNNITEVVLGTGTSSTGSSTACPINITYKSLHGQSVYTADELNASGVIGPVYITGLAFWVTDPPDHILPDFIIRMKHTTDANVANWQGSAGMVTVFSAQNYMPTAGDWDMLTFQTPFLWDGSQNIVVDTAFNLTEEWTWSGTVRYSNVSNGYRCTRDDYQDQTNVFTGTYTSSNRPNVKLLLIPYQTGPEIAVDPLSLDFGAVQVGSSSLQQFTIANSGDSVLSGSITTPTGYVVSEAAVRNASTGGKTGDPALREGGRNTLNFSIPAGADQAFSLTFAPILAISYDGILQISSNDPDQANLQILLSGSGFELSLVPPAVSVSLSGANRVLSWEAVPNANSYRVWSCGDPYGVYELLDTVSGSTTYTDTRVGLTGAFYRVTAVNE